MRRFKEHDAGGRGDGLSREVKIVAGVVVLGVIMSVLVRSGPTWDMTAIGEFHDGKTARAMYEPAEEVVRGL